MDKRRIALSAFLVLVMIFPTASPIANAESQIIEVTKVAYSWFTASQSGATLTGVLTDRGVDDDAEGLFEYLELGVQVNVATEGYYGIEVKGLATSNSTLIGIKPEVYISPYKAVTGNHRSDLWPLDSLIRPEPCEGALHMPQR